MMYQDPGMVDKFLEKLCKLDAPTSLLTTNASSTEEPFSMLEFELVLAQKKDSAPGMDGIKYGDIANFPSRVKEKFLQLVNDVWSTQSITETMKKILMVLIPKPGRDLKQLSSHRPIALLSVYLKTMNSMIKSRLEKIIQEKDVLNGNSNAFVKHRSAIDCVNHLLSLIKEKQAEGLQVMAIFLDLEDAFNNVNLRKLQSTMNRLGIPAQYTNWIINCYQSREISIETVLGNRTQTSNEGVPQGDVLSPLAFLLYTTLIFNMNVPDTQLFQFADDLCIIAWGLQRTEATAKLQEATSQLMDLITGLDMEISASFEVYQPIIKIIRRI